MLKQSIVVKPIAQVTNMTVAYIDLRIKCSSSMKACDVSHLFGQWDGYTRNIYNQYYLEKFV